ncbi:MAG TPA: carboxyl transferase domain-containing protein [Oligoflexus sp.]|uniref:carboxyl transferase domain-containing protein n=1 Tax=Oligoflexus sp. TaxID=1971216 RepID=UPI002D7FCC7F|nr:carboxyl transferase domain-containing protein [Oligoflexus sp.]HET9241116.1 carboxyl transferase domain-containing protein [Oligoflexus sp.]
MKRVRLAHGQARGLRDPPQELFYVVAGLELYREHIEAEQSSFHKNAARGRPSLRTESAPFLHLSIGQQTVPLKIARLGPDLYQLRLQGYALMLRYHMDSPWERSLQFVNGPLLPILVHADGESFGIEIEGVHETVRRPHIETVRAPGPGVIQSIHVKVGDQVKKGDSLLTLEAMKMELAVTAPCDGRVQQVFVVTNTPALRGSSLLQLQTTPSPLPLAQGEADAAFQPWLQHASESMHGLHGFYLKAVLLGYDVDPDALPLELRSYQQYLATLDIAEAQAEIHELLTSFIAIKRLFRKHPHPLPDDELDHFASEDHLITYLRTPEKTVALPAAFLVDLERALRLYREDGTKDGAQRDALYWLYQSKCAEPAQLQIVNALLEFLRNLPVPTGPAATRELKCLQDLQSIAQNRFQDLYELCLHLKYARFEKALFERTKTRSLAQAEQLLTQLEREPHRRDIWQALIDVPYPLGPMLMQRLCQGTAAQKVQLLGLLLSRYYCQHQTEAWHEGASTVPPSLSCQLQIDHKPGLLTAFYIEPRGRQGLKDNLLLLLERNAHGSMHTIELFLGDGVSVADIQADLQDTIWPDNLRRVTLHGRGPAAETCSFLTLQRDDEGRLHESTFFQNFHPSFADRLQLERWRNFNLERLPSAPSIFLFRAVARQNPKDERLVAMAEVRELHAIRDADGRVMSLPHLEHLVSDCFASIRSVQMQRPRNRLHWNVIELRVWPVLDLGRQELYQIARSLARGSEHLGLEKLLWRGPVKDPATGRVHDRLLEFKKPSGMDLTIHDLAPSEQTVEALTEYQQKVIKLRQRSLIYPYELIRMYCREEDAQSNFPRGCFQEYDLVDGMLQPVNRPWGENRSNIVVGTIRHDTERYPEGMQRVILLGDPSRGLGNLSEPECRRIIAALDLAQARNAPVEWFAISSGAKIAMDSGTENMDWIAAALRKIIDFTQHGGEINIVVMGINVGAQPYWNAEATMLMHTKGVLIMLPQSAMVLTGKRALDYSGGVSAEDDLGIGGYSRIMGINGQAQYFAQDAAEACTILLQHYEHSYVAPGERFPRPAVTHDPIDRDVCTYPHGGEFAVVGQVFAPLDNPGRKKPFEIRQIMRATIDQDHAPLERWADMLDAENAVVWDAHLGGHPVCLLGIESKPMHRKGAVHADGPEQWTGGTLFPLASKKIARAINAASGVRPLVVLANLSGFDGSPESMRLCQLEFGAEIGRAVVNFSGPIVFCVVSRFHGGAYVVFSKTLNDNLQILALEGTYASVIGGAPAAGVVFAGEVELRAQQHPDIVALQDALKKADATLKKDLYKQLEVKLGQVRALMVGQIAEEFDHEHSVQRALQVGSLHRIIAPERLRPEVIAALEPGMTMEKNRWLAGLRGSQMHEGSVGPRPAG